MHLPRAVPVVIAVGASENLENDLIKLDWKGADRLLQQHSLVMTVDIVCVHWYQIAGRICFSDFIIQSLRQSIYRRRV